MNIFISLIVSLPIILFGLLKRADKKFAEYEKKQNQIIDSEIHESFFTDGRNE